MILSQGQIAPGKPTPEPWTFASASSTAPLSRRPARPLPVPVRAREGLREIRVAGSETHLTKLVDFQELHNATNRLVG